MAFVLICLNSMLSLSSISKTKKRKQKYKSVFEIESEFDRRDEVLDDLKSLNERMRGTQHNY